MGDEVTCLRVCQISPPAAEGRVPRVRVPERGQVDMHWAALDEMIPDDHPVRAVWAFAARLDLSPLYEAIKAVEGQPGHPPADPRLLLALWLYATVEGVGSARALARLCAEHHAYRWLCGGVSMNHKTLADFRVTHGSLLDGLLADSFAAMIEAGMASLERVAQDGVRVRAAAGAASFRRQSRLLELRRAAAERVAELRAELETDPAAASRRQAVARERAARERSERIAAALAASRPAPDQGRCARLDHGCRRPGDEDGRRRLPAGLQPAARVGAEEPGDHRGRCRDQRFGSRLGAPGHRGPCVPMARRHPIIWSMEGSPRTPTSSGRTRAARGCGVRRGRPDMEPIPMRPSRMTAPAWRTGANAWRAKPANKSTDSAPSTSASMPGRVAWGSSNSPCAARPRHAPSCSGLRSLTTCCAASRSGRPPFACA